MTLSVGDVGIDYSYARPSLTTAAQSGAKFVIRYSAGVASDPASPSHSKNAGKLITPVEFQSILAAGLDIIANDEWYEARVTEGATAGKADGHASATLWKSCGLAKGSAIYPSWDAAPSKTKWSAVDAYLKAFAAEINRVGGYVLGVYAGTPYLKHALANGLVQFGWRPNAGSWSNDGLPYQPDTSTATKRFALALKAKAATPAAIWQTGNYWFNKSADEDLIVRTPVGSHLEAQISTATTTTKTHWWQVRRARKARLLESISGEFDVAVRNDGKVVVRRNGHFVRFL